MSRGLNPCFNGRWSARLNTEIYTYGKIGVLILVLMEDGLRDYQEKTGRIMSVKVLILVLMEDGLRVLMP